MRSSSTTSNVTFQPSSSRSTPSTLVGRRPVSSMNCSAAARTASTALRRPFDERLRVFFLVSAKGCPPFQLHLSPDLQALQQLVDIGVELLVIQLAALVRGLGLGELRDDAGLVVQLQFGLLGDLLGQPCDAADRSQWQCEEARDQAHAAPSRSSANECGASGPISVSWSRPAYDSPSPSTTASKSGRRVVSTRNDAFRAIHWCWRRPIAVATANGSSAATRSFATPSARASTAWPISSPRRMLSKWLAAAGMPRTRAASCATAASPAST